MESLMGATLQLQRGSELSQPHLFAWVSSERAARTKGFMKLAQLLNESDFRLLQDHATLESLASIDVRAIATDSRLCDANTLFVATPAAAIGSQDGHRFIQEALKRGACAVAIEDERAITGNIPVP